MQQTIDIINEMIKDINNEVQDRITEDIYDEYLDELNIKLSTLKQVKSRIQALGDGWIPVSERLPEFGGEYIVTREAGVVSTLEYNIGGWHWEGQEPMYGSRPTHWMPLPLPPTK